MQDDYCQRRSKSRPPLPWRSIRSARPRPGARPGDQARDQTGGPAGVQPRGSISTPHCATGFPTWWDPAAASMWPWIGPISTPTARPPPIANIARQTGGTGPLPPGRRIGDVRRHSIAVCVDCSRERKYVVRCNQLQSSSRRRYQDLQFNLGNMVELNNDKQRQLLMEGEPPATIEGARPARSQGALAISALKPPLPGSCWGRCAGAKGDAFAETICARLGAPGRRSLPSSHHFPSDRVVQARRACQPQR